MSHTYPKNCRLQLRKQIGRTQKTERTLISSLKLNLQMFGYVIFIRVCVCVCVCARASLRACLALECAVSIIVIKNMVERKDILKDSDQTSIGTWRTKQ